MRRSFQPLLAAVGHRVRWPIGRFVEEMEAVLQSHGAVNAVYQLHRDNGLVLMFDPLGARSVSGAGSDRPGPVVITAGALRTRLSSGSHGTRPDHCRDCWAFCGSAAV